MLPVYPAIYRDSNSGKRLKTAKCMDARPILTTWLQLVSWHPLLLGNVLILELSAEHAPSDDGVFDGRGADCRRPPWDDSLDTDCCCNIAHEACAGYDGELLPAISPA